jgi:ribosome-binding protein aMBF1 (putative translation factor)
MLPAAFELKTGRIVMGSDVELGLERDQDLPDSVIADIEDGVPALKALRHWKGFSIEQLATQSGVSAANIHGAEAGRQLSIVAQQALAKALGVGLGLMSK